MEIILLLFVVDVVPVGVVIGLLSSLVVIPLLCFSSNLCCNLF